MKKLLLSTLLLASSSSAFAVSPGGPDCGWGNMLFEGKSGLGAHSIASILNGTSGNASFGMTSGTNGCSPNGTLTYRGENLIAFSSIITEFSEDVAKGEGEALTTVAVILGIEKQDRAIFAEVTHQNFEILFPNESVNAEQVFQSLLTMMKNDSRLAKYVV